MNAVHVKAVAVIVITHNNPRSVTLVEPVAVIVITQNNPRSVIVRLVETLEGVRDGSRRSLCSQQHGEGRKRLRGRTEISTEQNRQKESENLIWIKGRLREKGSRRVDGAKGGKWPAVNIIRILSIFIGHPFFIYL